METKTQRIAWKEIKNPKQNEFQMEEPVVNGLDVWNMQLPFKQM